MIEVWMVLQAATASAEGWETLKGVMLTLSTGAVLWTARTVFKLRDDVRDLKTCVGTDGSNGLKAAVADMDKRLRRIEERNNRIDAVAEAERAQYQGPERRRDLRRERDRQFIPDIPPVDKGDGP